MSVVECQLCPKLCRIARGQSGECRVRVNIDGRLRAVTFGYPSALHVDPVEKKPLFHYKPGTRILSVATAGCNLHCKNCQNWQLSQGNPEKMETYELSPARLLAMAKRERCPSIAYTYSDPIVFYEYTHESAQLARAAGIGNVLVTAGYGNREPLKRLFSSCDAANIDLKFFDDGLYRSVCDGRLAPVLAAIVLAKEQGLWVELTHLVIPTLNDDDEMLRRMCRWIVSNLGPQTPLHLSRFSPRYKLKNLPPTPVATLVRMREVARGEGLSFVYVGNVIGKGGEDTRCPDDDTLLVQRHGYNVRHVALDASGRCPSCQKKIPGVWR